MSYFGNKRHEYKNVTKVFYSGEGVWKLPADYDLALTFHSDPSVRDAVRLPLWMLNLPNIFSNFKENIPIDPWPIDLRLLNRSTSYY